MARPHGEGLSGARVTFADGSTDQAETVIAADGLHSVARRLLVDAMLAESPPGAHGVSCLPYFSPAGERAPEV